ncbi:MAG: 4'-phosphopantetheinyl transferase superfamily protein [Bdellovibrionia bacterium]
MLITGPLLGTLQNELNLLDLRLFSSPQWGANNENYRQNIRSFLQNKLQSTEPIILDLEQPLTLFREQFISISHSPETGVVALATQPLGIDVESLTRITPKLVERISQPKELLTSPLPQVLWSAKEAAFKALVHFAQPQTMSQIEIGNWRNLDKNLFSYQVLNAADFSAPIGKGTVFCNNLTCLALFVFYS